MTPLKTLHILNKPPEHGRFRLCLSAIGPGDGLLLIENGVLALAHGGAGALGLDNARWLALQPDLEARGLLAKAGEDHTASFDDMVTLAAAAEKVINW